MVKSKKREKKPESAEEFAAKINKGTGKRNGTRVAFGWKR